LVCHAHARLIPVAGFKERQKERERQKRGDFFKIKAYISMAKILMEALYSQENDKAGQAITL